MKFASVIGILLSLPSPSVQGRLHGNGNSLRPDSTSGQATSDQEPERIVIYPTTGEEDTGITDLTTGSGVGDEGIQDRQEGDEFGNWILNMEAGTMAPAESGLMISDQPSLVPSDMPSLAPSDMPSLMPSDTPSSVPSDAPSMVPSDAPSTAPSDTPGSAVSDAPSSVPSDAPSVTPSGAPTNFPSISDRPSYVPYIYTDAPSVSAPLLSSSPPSDAPSLSPTAVFVEMNARAVIFSTTPSDAPSMAPSDAPSLSPSDAPSIVPSDAPSMMSSDTPSMMPSDAPSVVPSGATSIVPSDAPSVVPSDAPSIAPSVFPSTDSDSATLLKSLGDITTGTSDAPSDSPSLVPSDAPSTVPSDAPSTVPSDMPSLAPSDAPSMVPSMFPSTAPSAILFNLMGTRAPSDAPSMVPPMFPSTAPSAILFNLMGTREPSIAPSDAPSLTPVAFSVTEPTLSPVAMLISDHPSISPPLWSARGSTNVDEDGEYPVEDAISCDGSINGDFAGALDLIVSYQYTLVLKNNTDLSNTIIAAEKKFRNATLSYVCSSTSDASVEPLSVAATPDDVSFGICGPSCFEIDGQTSLQLNQADTMESATIYCNVLRAIRDFVVAGGLDSVEGIASATFSETSSGGGRSICLLDSSVSIPASSLEGDGAGSARSSPEAAGDGGAISSYPLITIGALAFGAIMLATTALVLKGKNGAGSDQLNSSTDADMASPSRLQKVQPIGTLPTTEPELLNNMDSQSVDPVSTLGFSEISLDDDYNDARSPLGSRISLPSSMPSPVRSSLSPQSLRANNTV